MATSQGQATSQSSTAKKTCVEVPWRTLHTSHLRKLGINITLTSYALATARNDYKSVGLHPRHKDAELPCIRRSSDGCQELTLTDLIPVAISQARIAQGLDEGQVLLEALQLAPQVGKDLCCRPSH